MLMAAATALASAALKAKAQSEAIQVASSLVPDSVLPLLGDMQSLGFDGNGMPALANFQPFGEAMALEGVQEASQGSVVADGSSSLGRPSPSRKPQSVDLDALLRALEENDGGDTVPDVQ